MRFSVVIPSFGRPERLTACLSGLAVLDPPEGGFEIIVVDDGSPQPVERVARAFCDRLPLRLFQQAHAGPARARNLGAAHASGEVLAFCDDDCVPRPDWLREFDRAACASPEAFLGGRTLNGCPENIFAATNQMLLERVSVFFESQDNSLQFFPSNNLAIPAAAFRKVGGFDSKMPLAAAEDRDLCARWLKAGGRLVPVPEAVIDHYHPQSFRGFLRMHFRYGRGAAMLHAQRGTSPLKTLDGALYRELLKPDRSGDYPHVKVKCLLGISQAATAAGYLFEAGRRLV